MLRVLKRLFNLNTTRNALVVNTGVTVLLMTSGDLIQQNIEKKKLITKTADYDLERTKHVAIVGMVAGPLMYGWYRLLDVKLPGKTFKTVAKKIFYDELVASPVFIFVYMGGISLLQGNSIKSTLKEIIEKFPFVYMVDLMAWPPLQFINFYFLPSHFRVTFVNTALICWNVFLSYVKHNDQNAQKDEHQ